jgi:hypothetical protein
LVDCTHPLIAACVQATNAAGRESAAFCFKSLQPNDDRFLIGVYYKMARFLQTLPLFARRLWSRTPKAHPRACPVFAASIETATDSYISDLSLLRNHEVLTTPIDAVQAVPDNWQLKNPRPK